MLLAFLKIFHCLHPDYQSNSDLQFRLRLLKFATFSASRFANSPSVPTTSALRKLREQNRKRAKTSQLYSSFPDDFDSAHSKDSQSPEIDVNSNEQPQNGVASNSNPYVSRGPTSLLDTLPQFMGLSAAQIILRSTSITDVWMKLAVDYMSHAFAEQILVYGAQGLDNLRQAFAWGFDEKSDAEEGSDALQINALFLGDDGAVDGWDDLRKSHMRAVCM